MSEIIRNVAIVAHVDHGKTTLVDSLLHFCGSMNLDRSENDCVLDSDPLERERGITIRSKNCAVLYNSNLSDYSKNECRINIIDTPGHADFGGEVERVLKMADGVILLVDAFEGPRPQTRFVLQKALDLDHPIIVVINKCDRDNARCDEVINEVFDLLVALGADDNRLDFQVIYASGRDGWTTKEEGVFSGDMRPLLDSILENIPAPQKKMTEPLQMLIASQEYSPYSGRIAVGRVFSGSIKSGETVTICHEESNRIAKVQKLHQFKNLGKVLVNEVHSGDLCAVEGLGDFQIGDTIACQEKPSPIDRIAVDEPTLSMLFRINDSPNSGRSGKYVTSRQLYDRLKKELLSNLALRVQQGDTSDEFVVSGRGLLHLGILLENMRREGYELTVGRPQVLEKVINGVKNEPIESLLVDVNELNVGSAMEILGNRGANIHSVEQSRGRVNIKCDLPSRSIIGLRSHMLTATAGEAVLHHSFKTYEPVKTIDVTRSNGVMVATTNGSASTYSMMNLSQRGILFVRNQDPIYAGQIVGENSRNTDMGVNIVKAKAFSNVRESTKEATVVLKEPREITLEYALEYIEEDELVEITPDAIRLRKKILSESRRRQESRK